jgi:3-methyladenine DNA glycosylase AlkD
MNIANKVKKELEKYINKEKAAFFPKFFKTGIGQYGEGDQFIGVTVPNQRKVSKMFYKEMELKDIQELLNSPIHEHRLTSLYILVLKFEKSKDLAEKKKIYDFYLKNAKKVNNWDLVDSSAHKIVGAYLLETEESRDILYKLAKSKNLWEQRISIISTWMFIREKQFDDTLKISEILLNHPHDLIHKAVGWMLREIGKKDEKVLKEFLNKHYKQMPRTMLRYAIEKFPEETRKKYLTNQI